MGKNPLQCLWAGMHPWANKSQQSSLLDHQGMQHPIVIVPPHQGMQDTIGPGGPPSKACQDFERDALLAMSFCKTSGLNNALAADETTQVRTTLKSFETTCTDRKHGTRCVGTPHLASVYTLTCTSRI